MRVDGRTTATVAVGGLFGAAAREALEQAIHTPAHGFPVATFLVNVSGAFLLGLILEALVRAGPDAGWRQRARLLVGTGFMGAYTTYSTLAVETDQLFRTGHPATGAGYAIASAAAGLVAAAAGIYLAAARHGTDALPVDPDVDR
ncbi:MAG TPA: CrcB family protein [Acidimicrobiales bacterium]|jgi:CrcB protein|nr:CrcB family protein [Acidimicrobiales bacterium]